jgi:hypothetical protein
MVLTPIFNAFSFSHESVPSVERLIDSIRLHQEAGDCVHSTVFQNDRDFIELRSFQPCWLKRIARKVKWEFPGGFPTDHAVYAQLLQVYPGSEEQEMHADGSDDPMFWSIFVPLTFHTDQGTTVFSQGVHPLPHCKNYMFDSTVLHYGQANNGNQCRWVLMLVVAPVHSYHHATCVDV